MQEDVALYASELIRLKAQIICSKFQPQTILAYAAAQQMQPADQQLIPQALQLIKDKPLRNFRIEVASDSLVQLDENQMKQDRLEFLNTYSNFLTQALPVGERSPEMIPMMMELLKYGVGAFKQARSIEGALDQAMDQLKKSAGQPKPDFAQQKAQAEAQMEQQKAQMQSQLEQAKMQSTMQIEQAKLQAEAQVEAQRQQMEAQRYQMEAQFKAQESALRDQFDRWKAQLDAATRITIARISANPADPSMMAAEQAATNTVMQDLSNMMGH
jgi:septal ring factor EnvC (AmiA/AmiB activator)